MTNKKGLKNLPDQFADQMKKNIKKYWRVRIEPYLNDNIKSSQIYSLLQFLYTSEKNCEIYWLGSCLLTRKYSVKGSKQLKIISLLLSVLKKIQCKDCLCILKIPKCNAYVMDHILTIYKSEKAWNGINNTNRTFHK